VKMGVIFGTTGFGIEVANPLSENWNFRFHGTGGDLDKSFIHSDIQYDADLKLTNIGALVDWHPGGSLFRVTGGGFYTKNKFNVTASLVINGNAIGNNVYTSAEVGSLTGSIETGNEIAPYFGIGYGESAYSDDGLGVSINLGVMYTGSPKVSLTADGLLASDSTFMSDLDEEEKNISSSNYFKVYPVISIGITYKF